MITRSSVRCASRSRSCGGADGGCETESCPGTCPRYRRALIRRGATTHATRRARARGQPLPRLRCHVHHCCRRDPPRAARSRPLRIRIHCHTRWVLCIHDTREPGPVGPGRTARSARRLITLTCSVDRVFHRSTIRPCGADPGDRHMLGVAPHQQDCVSSAIAHTRGMNRHCDGTVPRTGGSSRAPSAACVASRTGLRSVGIISTLTGRYDCARQGNATCATPASRQTSTGG